MNLRVNLLKENEYRYQGPVSKRFVIRVAGITGTTLLLFFLALNIHRNISLKANLKIAREEWEKIGSRYEAIKVKQQELAETQGLLSELDQWNKTRVPWNEILTDTQQIVPTPIQLTKLTVQGDWEFVKQTTLSNPTATQPPPEVSPVPARRFRLHLAGKAVGDLADDTVVQFARTIREREKLQTLFDTMRLQRFVRETVGVDEEVGRIFEIEGVSFARKME